MVEIEALQRISTSSLIKYRVYFPQDAIWSSISLFDFALAIYSTEICSAYFPVYMQYICY